MKDYVIRALQVSYLTRDQLEKIHEIEIRRGYVLPNWNIQSLLGIPPIKVRYNIPEHPEAFKIHGDRIDHELKSNWMLKTELMREELKSDVSESVLWTHSFDWKVFNDAGKVMWEYMGSSAGGKVLGKVMEKEETNLFNRLTEN